MINNQYARAMPPAQPQQILSSQQNVYMPENAALMQTGTAQLNEAMYYTQPRPFNINTMSQIQTPAAAPQQPSAHFQNPHSFLARIGGTTGMYDPRLARVYTTTTTTTNAVPSNIGNSTDLLRTPINSSLPSQSSTILIDNYAPQLQSDQQRQQQSQQLYPSSTHFSTSHLQKQLQHSHAARQQLQRINEAHSQAQQLTQQTTASNTSQTMHQLQQQQQQIPSTHHSIFLPANAFGSVSNGKMSAYLPFKVNSTFPNSINEMYQQQLNTATTVPTHRLSPNSSSPVVLDRINICINNHYAEPNFSSSPVIDTSAMCTNSASETPSLSSPIIPPIQHSAVIDPHLLIEPPNTTNHFETTTILSTNMATPVPSTVNEPDSTTASHTPPATPDNISNDTAAAAGVNAIQSPSTSSTAKCDELFKDSNTNSMDIETENSPCEAVLTNFKQHQEISSVESLSQQPSAEQQNLSITPPPVVEPVIENIFSIGDDVFVRIDDDRLYLGTIIDSKYQKYRVRFDDASEMWCSPKQMRKFGTSLDKSDNSSNNIATSPCNEKGSNDDCDVGTLCVSCKKRSLIDVEICERCGRGYHKRCTIETSPGSGEWMCKRCSKSMKVQASENGCDEYQNNCKAISSISQRRRRQLPYDVKTLHWDSKHRVNDEQIYCYCGSSGQFDYKMLQCCKCLNWYHSKCIDNFQSPMMRGDGFFIFCCTICANDGKEFLRRLQMNCVDFMHLVLYNLSAQKKHQQNKYHHLTKDIWPFVQTQKQKTALPEEWTDLEEEQLKGCVVSTLRDNAERFVCGRELKRDHYFYGLRNNGPPNALTKNVLNICREEVEINDKFIVEKLKLTLSKRAIENKAYTSHKDDNDTDGKFTSDDEIPIKFVIEKEKVRNKTEIHEKENDNKERLSIISENRQPLGVTESENSLKKAATKSHKRKAFTLSRPSSSSSSAAEEQNRRRSHSSNAANVCDSSSDENSSSSRCTSLDLIIPPPKNFLGANNPFSTVAATAMPTTTNTKKSATSKHTTLPPLFDGGRRSILGGPAIRNSVVNASALDFCSNLTVLKNAGMLPNLNTTNFARAAGQPRMVRTIKRRLSAKDIKIGPNQEIRRRRNRRLSTNVEVISTTTINPLSSFFPINISSARKQNYTELAAATTTEEAPTAPAKTVQQIETSEGCKDSNKRQHATHGVGRRLRLRQSNSFNNASTNAADAAANSRRNSLSGASTTSSISVSSSSGNATPQASSSQSSSASTFSDLQQTVNKYFGVGHLIETGEQFSLHAKRQLPNGQIQLLIEWGANDENSVNTETNTATDIGVKTINQDKE